MNGEKVRTWVVMACTVVALVGAVVASVSAAETRARTAEARAQSLCMGMDFMRRALDDEWGPTGDPRWMGWASRKMTVLDAFLRSCHAKDLEAKP